MADERKLNEQPSINKDYYYYYYVARAEEPCIQG